MRRPFLRATKLVVSPSVTGANRWVISCMIMNILQTRCQKVIMYYQKKKNGPNIEPSGSPQVK